MDATQREVDHFNAKPQPCRYKQTPVLSYEPGCWSIGCDRKPCPCRINDGDHSDPKPIILRWHGK
jgi:hypothetical protein